MHNISHDKAKSIHRLISLICLDFLFWQAQFFAILAFVLIDLVVQQHIHVSSEF